MIRRRWGGLLLLVSLFAASWAAQFLTQLGVARDDAHEHGQQFEWGDFWQQFLASTFENWQSEWLQLATQAVVIGLLANRLFAAYAEAQREEMREAVRDVLREQSEL